MKLVRPHRTLSLASGRRMVAAAVALSCAGFGVTAFAANGSAATLIPADAQRVTEVTVFLKAPHPAQLAALAEAHVQNRTQRLRELAGLVPSAATHDTVADRLRTSGLTVVDQTAWSVTATGSTSAIAAAFGTRPTLSARTSFAAASGALPALPSALAGDVSAVFPTTSGPAVFHHMVTSSLAGPDFRNADTPAGVTPSTGERDAGTTIATVQFADFNDNGVSDAGASDTAADLTTYATQHNLPDPVASGQYKAVHVAGGPSADDDTTGGDVEVDLDQESILSTAPTADQHAYFAPNTTAGFGQAFSAVLDDVTHDSDATLPDANITVLSSSWGGCEGDTGADAINAVEPTLESLAAAGVTVFSAAGDDGIYDCRSASGTGTDNSQADVDFPGSSPYVVSVGGTNLAATSSQPNNGSNWTEQGWSCTSAVTCQSKSYNGGTGGGASGSAYGTSSSATFAGFPAPQYQRSTVTDSPFAGAPTRLVPDIAADGDPATGFIVYSSNPSFHADPNIQVGGTSLAAPISAAQLDNALADSGRTTGVGDIHDALYSAYAQTGSLSVSNSAKVFRDVTSGSNGSMANAGADPSVQAQAGYDTVSGLGGVLWSALVPYLIPNGSPSVSAAIGLQNTKTAVGTQTGVVSWSVGTAHDNRVIVSTKVTVIALNVPDRYVYELDSSAGSGSFIFGATPGTNYQVTATSTDLAGTSSTTSSVLRTPIDDSEFALSKGWKRVSTAGDFGSTNILGSARTLSARVAALGRVYSVGVLIGPRAGKLGVYSNGKLIKTIDEYAARAARRTFTICSAPGDARRTFTFRPLGAKRAKSKGTAVTLDFLSVGY